MTEIEVQGQPAVALFDTGTLYSYARETLAGDTPKDRGSCPSSRRFGWVGG
ncbi:MAG: hypothetical protein QMD03_07525 [Syntrophales bacterium]|nr:hypothetical protein [Syntrophales bacterium]